MLLERHDVCQHLTGMGAISESVDDGHGRVGRHLEQIFMRRCANHDGVDVSRQHASSVPDRLATAELRVFPAQEKAFTSELPYRHVERDTRPRRSLFEDHCEQAPDAGRIFVQLNLTASSPRCLPAQRVVQNRPQVRCVNDIDIQEMPGNVHGEPWGPITL